ncbi:hypothetical protein NDU88_002063 [Pleurodeles waltl]|uniref:Uncharacterized protein n=1 Tax=Pleurodeles waltl TaxID=8319 RepID=A0AAV7U877_PLEWA|nr:hypothetical protein NDU88_002063 [Pleurodeles waltl]
MKLCTSTTSSEELLRRKYITSRVLSYYCQATKLEPLTQNSKKQLTRSILRFWSCDKTSTKTSRLKSYEGDECKKILDLLHEEAVTNYWHDLYRGRTPDPSRSRMTKDILFRIPEVRWRLRKKGVTAHVLREYLRQEGIYFWDNPSKTELIERVLAHISAHRAA